jgi:hypothetical protein
MTDDFAARVYPVFLYVLNLLERVNSPSASDPTPEEVSSQCRKLLGPFDVRGVRQQEYELARSALVYWIDEVLVNSRWSYAPQWSNHTLERELFDSRDRAWQFYKKAKAARALSRLDALETFYLCVCFGFTGLYREGRLKPPSSEIVVPGTQSDAGSPASPEAAHQSIHDTAEIDEPPSSDQTTELPGGGVEASWFAGESAESANETWGLGGDFGNEDALASLAQTMDDQRDALPDRLAGNVDSSLPATLQEWAETVYSQIAPEALRDFTPHGRPGSLRDAMPLSGRRALRRSSQILGWTFMATILLVTVKLFFN